MRYRFLIYITYPYSIPIGLPLQKEIEAQGHQVYWFCELEETKSYFKEKVPLLNNIEETVAYDPHIILTATDSVPDFYKGLKVQVFHGFPANKRSFKKDHFRIRGLFDLYTCHGPSTLQVFKEQAEKYKTFDAVETGWSKIDPLFRQEPKKRTGEKPVVMLASTFTKRLSLAYDNDFFQELKKIIEKKKYQFIAVLHPKIEEEVKDRFKALNGDFFQYYDTTDLNPLFAKADIMLSDTTSAISEFIMQKKVVVTYKNNRPEPHFMNITEPSHLEEALDYALTRPKEIILEINKFIEATHPYQDGKSSERIINVCISFVHKDKSYLKNKPLNLIRKWKIRKKLKYFTLKSYNNPFTLPKPKP